MYKNNDSLTATTTDNPIGSPFIELLCVDSTNNYAMQQVHKGIGNHGAVFFAHDQTAGKGQRGKQWITSASENIAMSVLLSTQHLRVSRQFALSMAVALGVKDFFQKYAGDETVIKWPNDIYWRDRKAGGILIENIILGQEWQWAVAGIGLNINQGLFNKTLKNPVSLKQITGKQYNPTELSKELCNYLEYRYKQLIDNKTDLLNEYNTCLYKYGKQIKLKKDNIIFDCVLKHVTPFGQLVVERGVEQIFNAGEVEWIIN